MQESLNLNRPQLLTLDQFAEKNPWPSKGSLYMMFKNRKTNGLNAAFSKWGRRIIVNEEIFFELVKEKG